MPVRINTLIFTFLYLFVVGIMIKDVPLFNETLQELRQSEINQFHDYE